ncbi:MAG: hypothetical protein RML72_04715 [Bacteroidia bacterium]|nr:hypothetical protein [Bacteroidia bacterium]MDW8158165.1 hypothetical protein [Bacteroidia bacterium]
MKTLNVILKQLSEEDYRDFYNSLQESSADKSSQLLKLAREHNYSDAEAIQILDVNPSAFYTLKFRLKQKIQEFVLQRLDIPQLELIKQVNNLPHLMYTQPREIALAVLKKLEKDLQGYDLPFELMRVYRAFKHLYFHTSDYYTYSQKYNQYLAYTLAIDKAEDLVAEFSKTYSEYLLTRESIAVEKMVTIKGELENVSRMYNSHRLYIYKSIVAIFFQLFVAPHYPHTALDSDETIEEILMKVDAIFDQYPNDPYYVHLEIIFNYLRFEYYRHYGILQKAHQYFEEINLQFWHLIIHLSTFVYAPQFLISKVHYYQQLDNAAALYEENHPEDFQEKIQHVPDVSAIIIIKRYLAISCYHVKEYREAIRYLHQLRNEVSLKKYTVIDIEIKLFLALLYCLENELELYKQIYSTLKRQAKTVSEDFGEIINSFLKLTAVSISGQASHREAKLLHALYRFNELNQGPRRILDFIKTDREFIKLLMQPKVNPSNSNVDM